MPLGTEGTEGTETTACPSSHILLDRRPARGRTKKPRRLNARVYTYATRHSDYSTLSRYVLGVDLVHCQYSRSSGVSAETQTFHTRTTPCESTDYLGRCVSF